MNNEELQQELNSQFPSEIAGIKRPTEPVESKHDFFLKMPQLISKDPVLYNKMNLLFSILLSNDNALKQNIDTILGKLDNDYAQLDSPEFSGIPTVPTPSISDNSTKIATTAFVKSLFTASKTSNGWWKDGNTGMIWQWCTPLNSTHNNSFPISFPNKVLHVFATNTNRQGEYVDNAFAYAINNSTYYYATKPSNGNAIGCFDGAVFAIGY